MKSKQTKRYLLLYMVRSCGLEALASPSRRRAPYIPSQRVMDSLGLLLLEDKPALEEI